MADKYNAVNTSEEEDLSTDILQRLEELYQIARSTEGTNKDATDLYYNNRAKLDELRVSVSESPPLECSLA